MPRSERVEIVRVRVASAAEWDAAWLASDHATWFHSRAWAEIWAEYRRGELEPAARVVELSDGKGALLPLCRELHPGSCRFRASPAGTYGGWLAEEPLQKEHAARLFAYLIDEVGALSWRVCPWDPLAAELATGIGEPGTSWALRLDQGFDALARRFSEGARLGARPEGLEVGIATELEEWRAYYALYEESLARRGEGARSRHEWDLFAEIRLRDPENARLWVARLGSEIVAGALAFYAPRHAAWWHASVATGHVEKRPMHLLLHQMILDACEQGLAIFDVGPGHSHDGVEAFKAGYAPERFPCPLVRTEPLRWRTRALRALASVIR